MKYLAHNHVQGVAVDLEDSFYCGDAAGRKADPTQDRPKSDFSCTDRKFAANIGVMSPTVRSCLLAYLLTNHQAYPFIHLRPIS